MTYQPWYVEYARAHNRYPGEQFAYDMEHSPGYTMLSYSRWITQRWAEYKEAHGLPAGGKPSEEMQADFTVWLRECVDKTAVS